MTAGKSPFRLLPNALAAIGVVFGLWSAAIWLTTGFEFSLGPLSVRAHRLDRSTTVAIVALLLAWIADVRLNGRNLPRSVIRRLMLWLGRVLRAVTSLVSGAVRQAIRDLPSARLISMILVIGIALTAVAASAYVWSMAPPLWLDEESIALNIRDRGFLDLGGALWLGQSAPLGWLVVQHAIVRLFGTGELALRFFPLAIGLSTIGAAVWIGRRWLNVAGQVMLVILCGLSQWFVHYRFEVKHYTADTFFSLLLPALVVWTLEAATPSTRLRRAMLWWITGALGLWLANGAMLVAPACALILVASTWRRDGFGSAIRTAALGAIWLVAFAAHYVFSLRATLQSQYLQDFWASQPAPLLDRFRDLASNPGGSDLWMVFWISAAAGFVFGRKRLLAGTLALIPISAWLFGLFGIVPFRERLALWIAPALYVGIALCADRIAAAGFNAYRARRWLIVAAAAACAVIEVRLSADVIRGGRAVLTGASYPNVKQGVNDRQGVRWLLRQLRPGDAVASTRMGWPALWWYGQVHLTDEQDRTGQLGSGVVEYQIAPRKEDCPPGELVERFEGHDRVLVYFGFRDLPAGYDALIMRRFSEAGTIAGFRAFGDTSWAAVVDLRSASNGQLFQPPAAGDKKAPSLANGCFSVGPSRLW